MALHGIRLSETQISSWFIINYILWYRNVSRSKCTHPNKPSDGTVTWEKTHWIEQWFWTYHSLNHLGSFQKSQVPNHTPAELNHKLRIRSCMAPVAIQCAVKVKDSWDRARFSALDAQLTSFSNSLYQDYNQIEIKTLEMGPSFQAVENH